MSASQMKFRQKQDGRISGVEKRGEDGDCRTSGEGNREEKSLNKEKI